MIAMQTPEMWDGELFDFDQLRITSWPHWWIAPTLLFAAITGPGGYWLLDPTAVNGMPHALYFALLGLVLTSLGILAIATVLAVLWIFDNHTSGGDA